MGRFKEAHGLRSRALGPDHPDVGSTEYKMALVCEEMQDVASALSLCHQALTKAVKCYGQDHPESDKRRQVLARLQSLPATGQAAWHR
mmetsp:Transcript_67422/g.180097  ORF Transcript_67422/g.180097 Transcript_67422/m.180097 type:complete len:88 (+) Transcript_67422:262-525(+)